jgi:hypothetical protein
MYASVIESRNLTDLRDDRHSKHWPDAWNGHEQLRLFPRCSDLIDFVFETLDLFIERLNDSQIGINDVTISRR